MLDLTQYTCLGAALRDALERFAGEVCLIEADRERENSRLTYAGFKQGALPLAAALQEMGLREGDRAAIIMTNQSKWLISAYAIFYGGGVIVPLDYKLSAAEHLQLLAHSRARFLIVEYHLWRAIMAAPGFRELKTESVLVTEAPAKAEMGGARRWEEAKSSAKPRFIMR
ncbi:MAG: AMP-binding protein, partial [Acidobacteriota bacterium]